MQHKDISESQMLELYYSQYHNLNDAERESLRHWTGDSSNSYVMRHFDESKSKGATHSLDSRYAELVSNVDTAMTKSVPIDGPTNVYRAVFNSNIQLGQPISDPSYISTSMTRDALDKFINMKQPPSKASVQVLQIELPDKFSSGVAIGPMSAWSYEEEYLIDRNTELTPYEHTRQVIGQRELDFYKTRIKPNIK